MSMNTGDAEHSTLGNSTNGFDNLPTDGDREKRCDHCRNRVTVGTTVAQSTGELIEYGHAKGCPHRPPECNAR